MSDLARLFNFTAGQVIDSEQVDAEFDQLIARINDIDVDSLSATLAALLGLSQTGNPARGKSIIAGSESRTNTAYGLMTTPDRVSGLVLPADGLLCVVYTALMKVNVAGAFGAAAIFLSGNQLKVADGTSSGPVTQAARDTGGITPSFAPVVSAGHGLVAGGSFGTSVSTGTAIGVAGTTDQELGGADTGELGSRGGVCIIEAAAGTYDVSVQFKVSSGSVDVKERRLRVWTMGF